ncbi:hypothetical protein [Tropicimonas sediminicola]|nr:hypothetical protein [Tropicimonas sediminicola]
MASKLQDETATYQAKFRNQEDSPPDSRNNNAAAGNFPASGAIQS